MRSREGNEGLARSRAEERSRWQKKKRNERERIKGGGEEGFGEKKGGRGGVA